MARVRVRVLLWCWRSLVCLTTGKRLTDYLRKLYNTPPPWNGGTAGRPDKLADVSIFTRFHFLGIPGRVFFIV